MSAPKVSTSRLEAFQEGAQLFNSGRYFDAHEAWERDWRRMPDPDRAQTQAGIVICGVFVLIGKGRLDAARRLVELAIDRFAEATAQSQILSISPELVFDRVEDRLLRLLAALRTGIRTDEALAEFSRGLTVALRSDLRARNRKAT